MTDHWKPLVYLKPAALWATALLLTACTQMVQSVAVQPRATGGSGTCHSAMGGYYLPKALLQLQVKVNPENVPHVPRTATLTPAQPTDANAAPTVLSKRFIADKTQTLCLDYLSSATSDDLITVKRDSNGLLSSVTGNAIDRTPDIAKTLIDAAEQAAIAAARGGGLVPAGAGDQLDLEFDPFDYAEMKLAKTGLRRFGYCLYVEGYSIPQGMTPASWCDARELRLAPNPDADMAALPAPEEALRYGILYRASQSLKIVILRKTDPSGPEPWALHVSQRVDMPNVSPIFAIGVERAIFAERNTTLTFKDGMLTDVTVTKNSELVGFVSIPLALAKAIVDIPTQIIQVKIADTKSQSTLLNEQGNLIKAM